MGATACDTKEKPNVGSLFQVHTMSGQALLGLSFFGGVRGEFPQAGAATVSLVMEVTEATM